MPAIGTVWTDDTWDVDAWAADTWADVAAEIPDIGDIFTATACIRQLTLASSSLRQHNLSTQFIKQVLAATTVEL